VPSAARAAKNESLFREVNERILELEDAFGPTAQPALSGFVCECSRIDCTSKVEMTTDEYRDVRESPSRFAVVPGHVDPDHERVVRRTDRFVVVEKFGAAGAIAADEVPT
jgi:hypothetical protein